MKQYLPSLLFISMCTACTSDEESKNSTLAGGDTTSEAYQDNTEATNPEGSSDDGKVPLFILAGQSNAEGNVRLAGLQALYLALPNHHEALSNAERTELRSAYRQGVGDWCNPAEDYSDQAADTALDAFRAGNLDLSEVAPDYTLPNSNMLAFRWRHQPANEPLGNPYQDPSPNPHPAHTTSIQPLGVGFGVWDDEETEALFYGPELGFAMHLHQNQMLQEFDMLKVAMGGSSLFEHWTPSGPLTEQLYQRTDAYLNEKPNVYVAGLIWFQGFNDQFEEEARNNYAANLNSLFETFRTTYDENMPIVIVQARKVSDLTIVAEAQQQVADTMDNVSIVASDGLTECFHYDATSQLVIGQRSADAMHALLTE